MRLQNINCKKYIDVCSAGVPTITGKHDGVFQKLGQVTSETKFVYCSIRPEIVFTESMEHVFGCTPEQNL